MRRVLLILVGTVTLVFASQALANPLCHSVLIADTELTGDLDCSGVDGDPLIVGADGITIRLNGWTLTCPPGFVNAGGELDVEGIRATNHVGVRRSLRGHRDQHPAQQLDPFVLEEADGHHAGELGAGDWTERLGGQLANVEHVHKIAPRAKTGGAPTLTRPYDMPVKIL